MKRNKSFWNLAILLATAVLMQAISCNNKEDEQPKPQDLPLVSTTDVTEITSSTASAGGTITDDGGSAVIARGVCWSTTNDPTISDFRTEDGSGAGIFISRITHLQPNTTYFARAYATNSTGTGYGNVVSFTTLIEVSTVTDIDGNVYTTTVIGAQEWITRNLRTTRYNDGSPIAHVADNSAWALLSTPAFCWYNNAPATYGSAYGALYNWYSVSTSSNGGKNLCPEGWRVPTNQDWTTLAEYVGGTTVAGTKLKADSGWYEEGNGTDDYGFSALPGGFRYWADGRFFDAGNLGIWWSSTEADSILAWNLDMVYTHGSINQLSVNKNYGFSIRCVKN